MADENSPAFSEDRGGPNAPRVFISYSHETPEHKEWVTTFATHLRSSGVDALLDLWELQYGDDITLFMEEGIKTSSRVILICTETYKKKAEDPIGGVGYERLIVTNEIAKDIRTSKYLCVLRSGDPKSSIPDFAGTRLFADFRPGADYDEGLKLLLRDIHAKPENPKPIIGPVPDLPVAPPVSTTEITKTDPTRYATSAPLLSAARNALRAPDKSDWKLLIRKTLREFPGRLRDVRATIESDTDRIENWKQHHLNVFDATADSVALGLTAADAQIPGNTPYESIATTIAAVSPWNYSGDSMAADIPESATYLCHYVLGASLVSDDQHQVAINLLMRPVPKKHRETLPIWKTKEFTGWPGSFGDSCDLSWRFLHELFNERTWIQQFFVNESDYHLSLCSYQLIASLLEFAEDLQKGQDSLFRSFDEKTFFALEVPPLFWEYSSKNGISEDAVLDRAVPNREILSSIASQYKVTAKDMSTYWPGYYSNHISWFRGRPVGIGPSRAPSLER